MRSIWVSLFVGAIGGATALSACVGDAPTNADGGSPGSEGAPCFANGTCNDGLTCISKVCVRLDGGPADGGPGDATSDVGVSDGTAADATDGADATNPCGSLQIPGGGGAVVTGSSAVLPSTGNYCYEAWLRTDGTRPSPIYLMEGTAIDNFAITLQYRATIGMRVAVQKTGQPAVMADYMVNPLDGQWHHVAGCRAINGAVVTLTMFLDGQQVATTTGNVASVGDPTDLRLGSALYAVTDGLGGYIDEVRVSNMLRYTTTFVPQSRFTSDVSTVLLLHFDSVNGATFADSSSSNLSGSMLGATT